MNRLILPAKGKNYSGTRSTGLVWLQNKKGDSFPSQYLNKGSAKVILYCHGNGGTLGDFKNIITFYSDCLHTSIFAPEYPGYGPAEGVPDESSVNDNVVVALAFLVDELKYKHCNIILLGYSIGTGPAIQLASNLCEQNTPPAAVVSIAGFMSVCDIVRGWKGDMFAKLLADFLDNRWDNMQKLCYVDCPILFLHGEKDNIIPFEHSQKMYAICSSKFKDLHICKQADHSRFNEVS